MHHTLALQRVQVPPFSPWYPASHTHQLAMADPCGLCELLGHARQALAFPAPTLTLYVPFGQFWHAPEEGALTAVE